MIRGLQNKTGGVKIVVMFCSRAGLRFHPGQKWNSKISTLIFFLLIFFRPINIHDLPLLLGLAEKCFESMLLTLSPGTVSMSCLAMSPCWPTARLPSSLRWVTSSPTARCDSAGFNITFQEKMCVSHRTLGLHRSVLQMKTLRNFPQWVAGSFPQLHSSNTNSTPT